MIYVVKIAVFETKEPYYKTDLITVPINLFCRNYMVGNTIKLIRKAQPIDALAKIVIVSIKYALILALLTLCFKLCADFLVLFPDRVTLILSFVVVFCISCGAFVAAQLNRLNARNMPFPMHKPEAMLSKREYEVFQKLLMNKSNSEICEELFVEMSTLKSHINRIYKKLEVRRRSELRKRYLN